MKSRLLLLNARVLRKRILFSKRARVAVRLDSSHGNSYSSLSQIKKASFQDGKRLFYFSRTHHVAAVFLFVFISQSVLAADGVNADVNAIVAQARRQMRGETMKADLEMTIVSGKSSEKKNFILWSEGTENAVLKAVSPTRMKGSGQLRLGSRLWLYQPTLDRALPIAGSELKKKWADSDVSYEDIVANMLPADRYEFKLGGKETLSEFECWKVTGTPKDAGEEKAKIVVWVSVAQGAVIRQERYDEEGKLAKVFETRKLQRFGKYWMPVIFAVRSTSGSAGDYTRFELKNVVVDQKMPESTFSQVFLKRPVPEGALAN